MKAMSIIGIVWFSLCFIGICSGYSQSEIDAVLGWGFFGMLYAIPYSITGLVLSSKAKHTPDAIILNEELIKLCELKEKGIVSEAEFNAKKIQLLNNR